MIDIVTWERIRIPRVMQVSFYPFLGIAIQSTFGTYPQSTFMVQQDRLGSSLRKSLLNGKLSE